MVILSCQDRINVMCENQTQRDKDQELIRRFREGDTSAFDELVLTYSPQLFRVAYGLLGNHQDAEEVVQDAFVRAHRALSEFRGDASFKTWMHRITVNLASNKFHWNQRRGEGISISLSEAPVHHDDETAAPDVDVPDMRMGPDRQLENDELERNIVAAVQHLPEKLRQTMILRHFEDMSYDSIAELLECKVGTVKSRLARGREMLRQILTALDEGKELPFFDDRNFQTVKETKQE